MSLANTLKDNIFKLDINSVHIFADFSINIIVFILFEIILILI